MTPRRRQNIDFQRKPHPEPQTLWIVLDVGRGVGCAEMVTLSLLLVFVVSCFVLFFEMESH